MRTLDIEAVVVQLGIDLKIFEKWKIDALSSKQDHRLQRSCFLTCELSAVEDAKG
ncbi:hypothetical protein O9H85_34355 [Paenibacillus filicis]|uniref:Transposase n=1 Tax=Paenibacillus gyeongsangnamensis TaxID=3388067 RepID=A0ABT4QKG0_9BACL|nr:hypothetical protein [Paenibacillus filicis]MCZ8517346.1 hypothetical protein [Paenibacillus filicis]